MEQAPNATCAHEHWCRESEPSLRFPGRNATTHPMTPLRSKTLQPEMSGKDDCSGYCIVHHDLDLHTVK